MSSCRPSVLAPVEDELDRDYLAAPLDPDFRDDDGGKEGSSQSLTKSAVSVGRDGYRVSA